MTDEERNEELVYELVDIAKDLRKLQRGDKAVKRFSVSLLVELQAIEVKALDAVKRLEKPKEPDAIIVTDANKKH